MRRFLDNIELWLSTAGLLVVWIVAALFSPAEGALWQVAAITALVVSVLHGILFWIVRRRQRQIRAQSIHEIRELLADRVKNQLAVMKMWMPDGPERQAFEVHFEGINESIDTIGRMVDGLSEEALTAWKAEYANAAEHIAPQPALG